MAMAMKAVLGHIRDLRVIFALVLLVFGGLGQNLTVHADMTGDTKGMHAIHAMASMPMNHSGMDGMPDADKALRALQCLALAFTLPVSPAFTVPIRQVEMARPSAVLLPLAHVSSPDGPPPKLLELQDLGLGSPISGG
jgi:hypothetical protein